jgi:hypothetical protein
MQSGFVYDTYAMERLLTLRRIVAAECDVFALQIALQVSLLLATKSIGKLKVEMCKTNG